MRKIVFLLLFFTFLFQISFADEPKVQGEELPVKKEENGGNNGGPRTIFLPHLRSITTVLKPVLPWFFMKIVGW